MAALAAMTCASAQSMIGEWNVYPLFSSTLSKVVETPSGKVYYLSGGSLYSYDLDSDEHYAYTRRNKLNGSVVQDIVYNPDKDYLLVVYEDTNLDLIYDDGKVVNIPDIRDSQISYSRQINDVFVHPTGLYIALNFGIVVIDDERHEVRESGIYGKNIDFIGVMGDNLMIIQDYGIFVAPLESRHNNLDKFRRITGVYSSDVVATGESSLLAKVVVDGVDKVQCIHFFDDFKNWKRDMLAENVVGDIQLRNGGTYVCTTDRIHLIDEDGNFESSVSIPESLSGNVLYFYSDPEKVFVGSEGLSRVDISKNPPAVMMENIVPENRLTCERIAFMVASRDGERIYISNLGPTEYNQVAYGDVIDLPLQRVNVIENGVVDDLTLKAASADNPYVVKHMAKYPDGAWLGSPGVAVEDPDDKGRFYVCNGMEGIYVIKDGEEIGKFNSTNSKMDNPWGNPGGRTMWLTFDRDGNMWVANVPGNAERHKYGSLIVLPSAKRKGDPKAVTVDDWVELPVDVFANNHKDMRILVCEKSNMVFAIKNGNTIISYDTNGTYSNFADDKYLVRDNFVDQDGMEFTPHDNICMVEDKRGRVWMGTSEGIIELTNPAKAISTDFHVNRIKVPRNDGTNLADYLLSSETVYSIAVDHSNRKWVATGNSGVYLVSENGDEILEHFTTENSFLPSNAVYAAAVDSKTNRVYFGTDKGLVSYTTSSSPAQDNYDNILVYPNPVRPDYEGPITIKGLMEGSLVKIADSMGHVVFHTRSEGGMATWDGCNESGQQVRSGVYYVLVSQNLTGSATGAVAKIVIVR